MLESTLLRTLVELLHFARRPGAGHDYLTQAKWIRCEREIVLRDAGCQRECEGAGEIRSRER